MYGRSLEIHLAVTHAKIAYPLRQCIRALNNSTALCEEVSCINIKKERRLIIKSPFHVSRGSCEMPNGCLGIGCVDNQLGK